MGLQDDMAAVAREMLADPDFGLAATVTRNIAGTYDTAQGKQTGATTQVLQGNAVRDNYRLSVIDGTRIKTGDIRLYLALPAGSADPVSGDDILFDSVTWKVVDCKPIKPGALALLYDVQARKP